MAEEDGFVGSVTRYMLTAPGKRMPVRVRFQQMAPNRPAGQADSNQKSFEERR
jgi:hypothetical protein